MTWPKHSWIPGVEGLFCRRRVFDGTLERGAPRRQHARQALFGGVPRPLSPSVREVVASSDAESVC